MTDQAAPAPAPAPPQPGYATALQVQDLARQVAELKEVVAAQHKRIELLEALAAQVKAVAAPPAKPLKVGALKAR